MTSRPVLVALLIVSVPKVGQAQAGQEGTGHPELSRALAGQSLARLRLVSGQDLEVREPVMVGDAIRGTPHGAHQSVDYPVRDLERVWRRGSAAGTGFKIGMAVGAIAGAAGGVALANLCLFSCPSPSTSDEVTAGGGGALAGALIGGAVGALIAAPIRRWKTVYRGEVTVAPIVTASGVGVSVAFR